MTTMPLFEFMKARIAEDELAIGRSPKIVDRKDNGDPTLNWPLVDRLSAECEAKRQIVQYAEALWFEQGRDVKTAAQYRSMLWVVQRLASACAGHPDYEGLSL
jgi:hypothetical protein